MLPKQFVLAPLVALFLATGCHAPASHAATGVSVRTAASVPSAVSQVQSSPLYRQARQDCKVHDYRKAVTCLETLAHTPGLAPEALTFVQQQRDICLRDAGLLRPAPTPVVVPSHERISADADCGPRALLLVCQKLGMKTTLSQLRATAGTTAQGTTLAGLQQAARKIGLQAEGVQVNREALPDTAFPALAWINRNHYVALLALSGSGDTATATIHDPNKPSEKTLSQEQLLQRSGGYLLLVHR